MNRTEHIKISLVISLTIGSSGIFIFKNINWIFLCPFVLVSLIGSLIPDMVEPPYGWKHRKFFHSGVILLSLLSLGVFFILYLLNSDKLNVITYILLGFIIGYSSHLCADAMTPRGLPFI